MPSTSKTSSSCPEFAAYGRAAGSVTDECGIKLPAAGKSAAGLGAGGQHDGACLAREAHCSGALPGHDLTYGDGQLWLVNPAFNDLCTLEGPWSLTPRCRTLASNPLHNSWWWAAEHGQPQGHVQRRSRSASSPWRRTDHAGAYQPPTEHLHQWRRP